jgi:hypothetical protein
MGVSTDGILVFGIDLDEEQPEFMDGYDDWWHFTDVVGGVEDADYAIRSKLREEFPVDLVQHCSYDYPMYILAVNGTERRNNRGYLTEINPEDMIIPQEKIDKFKAFCEEYGIEWQEPKWYLISMWG